MSQRGIQKEDVFISDEINEWIQTTWTKRQVNLKEFVFQWVNHFWDNDNLWPASHRKKSNTNYRKYDYDIKQKSNLFNLDPYIGKCQRSHIPREERKNLRF